MTLELRSVSYRYPGYRAPGAATTSASASTTARSSASSGGTRPASRRCAWSPSGPRARRRSAASSPARCSSTARRLRGLAAARARRARRDRVRQPGEPAVGGRRHGLRGGRARAGQSRAAGRRDRRAGARGARGGRDRGPRRAPAGPAVRRPDAARRDRVDAGDAPANLVLDEPVAELDPEGAGSWARPSAPSPAPARRCSSPSTTSTCWPLLGARIVTIDGGRIGPPA